MTNKTLIQSINIGKITIGPTEPLVIICGPCVIESEKHALTSAETLKKIFLDAGVELIYKSSYDKANRSSKDSYRGPGLKKGLKILEKVKQEFDLPILTDIHHPEEAKAAAEICDIIQIPAFLCRQTDLLIAAGKTQIPVNIKKGQFMAPWDMKHPLKKILSTENHKIILTDRGTCFGYNHLISDMKAIPIMQQFGFPVCFDATHSIQLPGGLDNISGGTKEFIPTLAKAALAAGANLLFIEAHFDPQKAKSDSQSMISFSSLVPLLKELKSLYTFLQSIQSSC